MNGESPQPPGDDGTTGAICKIIDTLGGESGEVQTADMAASGADDGVETQQTAGVPGRENVGLEKRLVDEGVFSRGTAAQRRVLGCMACRLGGRPGGSGMVTSGEIASCTGMDTAAVRRILGRLAGGGYVSSRVLDGIKYTNRPPGQFSLTEKGAASHFKELLEAPPECGLEQEGGRHRPNSESERKLIEAGVFGIKGSVPRAVLGCLACRLQRGGGEGVHPSSIERCQEIPHSSVLGTMKLLIVNGVLRANTEEKRTTQGRPRVFYSFTDSELARSVQETLEVPERCGLESSD